MGFDMNQKHKKTTELLQILCILSLRSEEALLFFFVFLIYMKTHNRMEMNL